MNRHLLLLLALSLISLQSTAQNQYENVWPRIDTFMQKQLPQSAVKVADSVYKDAQKSGGPISAMKAQLYLLQIHYQLNDNGDSAAIYEAEHYAATAEFPYKAMWQSITAQLYWNYYQSKSDEILERSNVKDNDPNFEFWDARHFFEKITALYFASLKDAGRLKKMRDADFYPILSQGKNSPLLRPTLFDLLAYRALAYFNNDEKDITESELHFTMNDPAVFDEPERFMVHHFTTKDSSSAQFRALLLYQQLLAIHIHDANKSAFVYADMERLDFANKNSVAIDKKELYIRAMRRIAVAYPDDSIAAMAQYKLAEQLYGEENDYADKSRHADKNRDYTRILSALDKLFSKFPKSEAGISARNLANKIKQKTLEPNYEKVILPDEYSRILVTYKNVPKIWVRIVPVDAYMYLNFEYDRTHFDSVVRHSSIQEFSISLPGSEDYKYHDAEVKLDPLPAGRYGIWISDNKDFVSSKDSLKSSGCFAVSSLCMVKKKNIRRDGELVVLNRKTGWPVANALVKVHDADRENKVVKMLNTGKNCFVPLPNTAGRQSYYYDIAKDNDTLYNALSDYTYNSYEAPKDEFKSFFFTDRSIYRPGQTIYFKGITVLAKKRGVENNTVKDRREKVFFIDANETKTDSVEFTTNEYGSVTGKFDIPVTGLTGEMKIGVFENQVWHGADFNVEEYKRPKFNATFLPLKADYSLNEKITVSGKAAGFAGNNIDGATVKYKITRSTVLPYTWLSFLFSSSTSGATEILHGTTVTGSDGKFEISFVTKPDSNVNAKVMPYFSYVVTAEVTDINGETHSAETSLNAGYISTVIASAVPLHASLGDLDSLPLTTQNLNGTFIKKDVKVTIHTLLSPESPLRERMWKAPDMFTMSEKTFRRYFPDDVYKDENAKERWSTGEMVFEKTITTYENGNIKIPRATWSRNGWYVIEMETTDKTGAKVTEKKYMELWDNSLQGKVTEPLRIAGSNVKSGNTTAAYILSAFNDSIYVMRSEQRMNDDVNFSERLVDNGKRKEDIPISKQDEGGIMLKYLLFKNNRAYEDSYFIPVPRNDKDLEITWETHRDKLLPGQKETWVMTVKGKHKEIVATEMAATMYDASLDELLPHSWEFGSLFPTLNVQNTWSWSDFSSHAGNEAASKLPYYRSTDWEFDDILCMSASRALVYSWSCPRLFGDEGVSYQLSTSASSHGGAYMWKNKTAIPFLKFSPPVIRKDVEVKNEEVPPSPLAVLTSGVPANYGDGTAVIYYTTGGGNKPKQPQIAVRKNLRETAFFYPQLHTDDSGNIRISFTMPEALTEWKLMTIAHTKDMATGTFEGKIKTQKDLMVVPNLPRFLRQKDEVVITAKINNLTANEMKGTAYIELLDAATLKPLNSEFKIADESNSFSAQQGKSTLVTWKVHVPENSTEPVIVRIKARAGDFTDGEENTLMVLSDRMMVTETMPIYVNGNNTKEYRFDKLLHSAASKSLAQYALTVEYTGNPAWYALQAMPYLMEFPHECAEQTFNRYFANALGAHIMEENPKLKEVFKKWEKQDTTALLSNLDKNEELKSALLLETPWVMQAKTETEQRNRIAVLFETHKLARNLDANISKLNDMLIEDKGFPWFKGMQPDRYITQYILTGLEHLRHLGVKSSDATIDHIVEGAMPWIDSKIEEDLAALIKHKNDTSLQQIGYAQIQYLYLRGLKGKGPAGAGSKAFNYYKKQAVAYWRSFNPYMKGMIALSLYRLGDKKTPNDIVASLKETAIRRDEPGMWWKQTGEGYSWYESPIEAQAMMIECFTEIAHDVASVDAMKIWLLKQKQTQSWPTTISTAEACYALLLSGSKWTANEPVVSIQLGKQSIKSDEIKKEAGTGYFKVRYGAEKVEPGMGNIKVQVKGNEHSTSWGSVSWQYFEDMDKITAAKTPLVIKKKLFIEQNTSHGTELQAITETNPLKVGDKVKVRIEISADRDMEYVHLKDMRASCFEPVNVISEYKYQSGLGYYESTKDASSNFFFSSLPKGKYVFEYTVLVMVKGDFSNGISTIQCMYAPEFSAHSEGIRVKVQ